MEFENTFSICFASTFLFIFVLFKLVKRSSSESSTTKLPPGPWKLPLIGNIHHLYGSALPHRYFKDLAAKYGPLMHLKLGEVSNIIVTSPEIAKQIMKTHDFNFSDRPHTLLTNIISYNSTDMEFSKYGDYWRQLKKICTMELLSKKRVQSFRFIREEEVSKLVKTISASEGSIVNLSEKFYSMLHNIAARAAFGEEIRYQEVLISAIEKAMMLAGEACVADLFPSIRVLQMMCTKKGKLEKLHTEIDRILQDIIDDHKNRNNSHCEAAESLLDALLKLQQDSEPPLSDDNVKAVIQEMFSAGGETTSGIVVWGMSELMKNPKVMEEAQVEVRRVFDSKGYVDESELHQLIYLKSVIKETLRLHPSVPLLLPRENRERCKINGYEIPAKSTIIINAWAIGRDHEYWTEAESFKPERFLNNSIDYGGTDFEYIPFGAGRRMCPGIAFAFPNIELALAQLLYHFDWKLPNGMKNEEFDMTEVYGMTLGRKNDLCLIPITRQP